MKKEYQATNYESDLTDKQWEAIKEFFPSGNKSKYHKRSLVEAVLYIVKTGCHMTIRRMIRYGVFIAEQERTAYGTK